MVVKMISHYDPFGGINPVNGLTADYINGVLGNLALAKSRFERGKISEEDFYEQINKPIPFYFDFFKNSERYTPKERETIRRNAHIEHLWKLEDTINEFMILSPEEKAKNIEELISRIRKITDEDIHNHLLPPHISREVRKVYMDLV